MALAPIQSLPEIASLVSRSCYEHLSLSQRFLVRFIRSHFFPFTCLNCFLEVSGCLLAIPPMVLLVNVIVERSNCSGGVVLM